MARPQNLNVHCPKRGPNIWTALSFDLSQLLNSHHWPSDIVKNPSNGFCGESERDYKWELNSGRLHHNSDLIIVSCDRSSVRIDEQFYVPNPAGLFDTQPNATMSQQLL